MRSDVRLALLSAILLCTGCASAGVSASSGAGEIDRETFVAASPREKVHAAVVEALEHQGYPVVFDNAPGGEISTIRKLVERRGGEDPTLPSGATSLYRSYQVRIRPLSDGRVEVFATSQLFRGERELSEEPSTAQEGAGSPKDRWKELFRQVQARL